MKTTKKVGTIYVVRIEHGFGGSICGTFCFTSPPGLSDIRRAIALQMAQDKPALDDQWVASLNSILDRGLPPFPEDGSRSFAWRYPDGLISACRNLLHPGETVASPANGKVAKTAKGKRPVGD